MNNSKYPRRQSLSATHPRSHSSSQLSTHPNSLIQHPSISSQLLPLRSYSLSRRGSFAHTSSFVSELSPTDPSFHRFFSRKLSVTPSDVRVLVVDGDNVHSRDVASQLANAGYPVDVVDSIETALTNLKSPPPLSLISGIFNNPPPLYELPSLSNATHNSSPDCSPFKPSQMPLGPEYALVICDISSVNGLELLRSIRSDLNLLLIPVIMMASIEEMELANGSLRAGADDYFIKPVKIEAVKGVWRNVWRKRKEKKVLQLLEEERQKRKSLEVKLESLEHQVSSAIETPIQLITQAISSLISSEQGMSDSAKVSLRQVLDGLRSSNLYRPAFERVLSRHDVDAETKSWLANEVLRDQSIVTTPNTTANSTCTTPTTSPGKTRIRRISETQRRKLIGHRAISANPQPSTLSTLSIPFAVEDAPEIEKVSTTDLPLLIQNPSHLLLLRSWNFDVWSYTHAELLVFLVEIFVDLGLLHEFQIDPAVFFRFLKDVELGYNQNAYHNFRHAFDVTQAAYLFLRSGCPEDASSSPASSTAAPIMTQRENEQAPPSMSSIHQALISASKESRNSQNSSSPLTVDTCHPSSDTCEESEPEPRLLTSIFPLIEQFSLMLACTLHDIGHDGKSNNFHIQTQSPLSILYNDQSPQENKHIHQGYLIMTRHTLLAHLPKPVQTEIRTLMIRCILSTDLGNHVEVLARFNEISPKFNHTAKEHRARSLEMLIKCADVSNVVRPLHLAKGWADCIQEEMFEQGDLEREMGLVISGFSDRTNPQSARLGLGFSEFLCAPLFRTISQSLPVMTNYLAHIAVTQDYWASIVSALDEDNDQCMAEGNEDGDDGQLEYEDEQVSAQKIQLPMFNYISPHPPPPAVVDGHVLSDIPSEPETADSLSQTYQMQLDQSLRRSSVKSVSALSTSSISSAYVSPSVRITPPLILSASDHLNPHSETKPIPPPTAGTLGKSSTPSLD